jgi:Spy/CpxP family protein refolding chaperone
MRAKRLFHAVTLTLVAAVFAASAAYAAQPPTGTGQPNRWESRLQQKLGLTEDQLQALRQVWAGRDVEAQRAHYKALRTAQGELRRLALNGADDKTLQAKETEVQTLIAQGTQMRVAALKQVGPILKPDQREAFAKMMERGPRGHHHRGGAQPQPQTQQEKS